MPLPPLETICTLRTSLREACPEDLPDLLQVNSDPDVTRFLPYATWQSMSDATAWLERMGKLVAAGTARQLVIVRNTDSRVIGAVLLFRYDEGSQRLELGYVLGRPYWQQGYTAEALRALLNHVFGVWQIRRIEAEVHPDNQASNALLKSLGFRHEGFLRDRWVAKGETYGVNVYGLLASDIADV